MGVSGVSVVEQVKREETRGVGGKGKVRVSKAKKNGKGAIGFDEEQSWYVMDCSSYSPELLRRTEWLLTDGLGGYAMGTALGLNTKRYHGLLVCAMRPPLNRVMLVNGLAEQVVFDAGGVGERRIALSYHEFADGSMGPGDVRYLARFEKGVDFCRWVWEVEGVTVCKELRLNYQVGGAEVGYRILRSKVEDRRIAFEVRPLTRIGNHHRLHETTEFRRAIAPSGERGVDITGSAGELYIEADRGEFELNPEVWYQFKYVEETARGLEDVENLHSPGIFRFEAGGAEGGDDGGVQFTLRLGATRDQVEGKFQRGARRGHLKGIAEGMAEVSPGVVKKRGVLIAAGDDFVVPRRVHGRTLKTILAGYPWFSDWGRDTSICVPGLLLATGRYEEALETLRTFAEYRKNGLIPNVFDDIGGAAHYNTVDGPLWFCHTACEYVRMTGDRTGFDAFLREACLDIISHYQHGTDFNIKMDADDGLICAGDSDTQLTWMDARRDGVTFTPRYGKAVEINALWYHDLLAVADVIGDVDGESAKRLRDLAGYVGPNLRETFWCKKSKCLYDCVYPVEGEAGKTEWVRDDSVRPNQLFAVSLAHSAFNERQQKSIVRVCGKELLTPMGLRTLSPDDEKYRGRFEGDMFHRDGAYHQGTVWPWLIGSFTEAYLRSHGFSKSSVRKCKTILNRLVEEMKGPKDCSGYFGMTSVRSLGQLFEVYDGDESAERVRMPGGCMAQAWSVAEVLRMLVLIEAVEGGGLAVR